MITLKNAKASLISAFFMNTQDDTVWFSNLIISDQLKPQWAICSPGR